MGKGADCLRRLVLVLLVMAALVLASGVALALSKIGTNGPGTLRGTNGNDERPLGQRWQRQPLKPRRHRQLGGRDGQGRLVGWHQALHRSRRQEPGGRLRQRRGLGGRSFDSILGGPGNDFGDGSPNSDNVAGEEGTDVVFEGGLHEAYKDNLSGGPGNDWVAPLNDPAYGDMVTCGSGLDRVLADRKDVIAPDCEKVSFGLASEEAFFETIPQSFDKGLS